MLLTSDLHLDDRSINDYRWKIFETLKVNSDGDIYILGDICDRADRHSSALVNRFITELTNLTADGNAITILAGNHDQGLKPPVYWEFLNQIPNVRFIVKPTALGDLLMLPHSPNPCVEWEGLTFNHYRCIFLHQTVNGADMGTRTFHGDDHMPLPFNVPAYSGDVHYPQSVGPVTYVGAPHPVRFGDNHRTRLLLLNEDYGIEREIIVRRMRKRVIEISNLEQLQGLQMGQGDQCRVRFRLPPDEMDSWPTEQAAIAEWARNRGVHIASIEAIVETSPSGTKRQFDFDADPKQVLEGYCLAEGVGAELLSSGLEILKTVE